MLRLDIFLVACLLFAAGQVLPDASYAWNFRGCARQLQDSVGGVTATFSGSGVRCLPSGAAFDGTGGMATLSSVTLGGPKFAFEVFAKFTALDKNTPIFDFGLNIQDFAGTIAFSNDEASAEWYVSANGSSAGYRSANARATGLEAGVWTHLVLVHDSGALTIYKDGQSLATMSWQETPPLAVRAGRVGCWRVELAGPCFRGVLSSLTIWQNVSITSDHVAALYTLAVAKEPAGLSTTTTTRTTTTELSTSTTTSTTTTTTPCPVELNPPESSRSYSSVWNNDPVGTGSARSMLDSTRSWIPLGDPPRADEWMTIDLGAVTRVHGVILQGRADLNQWVTQFVVSLSTDGSTFTPQGQTFTRSTTDRNQRETSTFSTPQMARYVRIIVKQWNAYASIRAGVLGCMVAR